MNEDLDEIAFLYRREQKGLLESWSTLLPEKKKLFLHQLQKYDEALLLKQQQRLLEMEEPPFSLKPLKKFSLKGNQKNYLLGKELIAKGKMGCIVLSGGQGTRLGFQGPKGCAPITLIKGKSLFQFLSEKCVAASEESGIPLSLAFMTSPLNHEEIVSFFKHHHWFGLKKEQVDFFSQDMLPLLNDKGNWVPSHSGLIAEGPNGNGSLIPSFYHSKIALKWKEQGIDFVNVIPIDNPLADPFDAEFLGFTKSHHLTAGVKAIEKTNPHANVGVIGTDDERLFLIEYTDLPEEEKKAIEPDGSLRWKVANLSLFCFSLDFLLKLGSDPSFELPWHLHLKNSLWKFETFLFDALKFSDKSDVLLYPEEECYAPLKNKEGENSFETVKRRLLSYDQSVFYKITGNHPPDLPFELDPHFYYPTKLLLKEWQHKKFPNKTYISHKDSR